MRLLLISSSKAEGYGYLDYALPFIQGFLGRQVKRVAFVPYAGVIQSYGGLSGYDAYEARVRRKFGAIGYEVLGTHTCADHRTVIEEAEAIAVGGGNTWNLLKEVQERGIVQAIRRRVLENAVPYLGWSAGANLACPTIRTTNDMPIVEPETQAALGLVPFQINPHYLDASPEGHFGESREERIVEFLERNRDIYVAGLREGTMFEIDGEQIELKGALTNTCRVFRYGTPPQELGAGDDFSFLLART